MKKAVPFLCALAVSAPMVVFAFPKDQMKIDQSPAAAAVGEPAPAIPELAKGKVAETMNAGGYTYILLEKKDGEKKWFAIPTTTVKVGQEIAMKPGTQMGKFTSKSLKREFENIVFSDGLVGGGEEDKFSVNGKDVSPGAAGASTKAEKIRVDKLDGGYTVGEIFKKKADLNGKTVKIRGKVVKVSEGIMNRNWIHIQDGTGDAMRKTHNLVVNSDKVPAIGDIIVVTGTLTKDKDFGSGYKYDVIIEKADFKKEEAKKAEPKKEEVKKEEPKKVEPKKEEVKKEEPKK